MLFCIVHYGIAFSAKIVYCMSFFVTLWKQTKKNKYLWKIMLPWCLCKHGQISTVEWSSISLQGFNSASCGFGERLISSSSVFAACPIQFAVILRDSLEVLLLNDNQLECVPPSVCALKNLSELYLSKWVARNHGKCSLCRSMQHHFFHFVTCLWNTWLWLVRGQILVLI